MTRADGGGPARLYGQFMDPGQVFLFTAFAALTAVLAVAGAGWIAVIPALEGGAIGALLIRRGDDSASRR